MRIELSEEDKSPLDGVLVAGFEAFNGPFVGPHGWKPIRLMVFRDAADERPCGGLLGHCYAGWLHVLMFWLPEDLRRGRLGADLLRRAEGWARGKGCAGAYLDTLSWQARPFHEKQGHRLFGELPDHPPGSGQRRVFLMKRFAEARGDDVPA